MTPEAPTNLTLAAGATNVFFLGAAKDVYYGVSLGGATADVRLALSPAANPDAAAVLFTNHLGWVCPVPGTYRLELSSTSSTPVAVRLYTYTNTILFLTQWITNQMALLQVAGVSIALVDDQDVAWARGFGWADVEAQHPVTTDTVFHIGSVSKTFTAAAVLQYVEQGYLDLEAPFTNYTPAVSWKSRYAGARSITVRDLLAHHSGLPGDLIRGGFTTAPLGKGYENTTNDLAGTYPIFAPGTYQSYCNAAFVLLEGLVEDAAERATGMWRPFHQIVDENLFSPLDMNATSYRFDKPAITNLIAPSYIGGIRMPLEFVEIDGTGSMYSRPTDMARFISALFTVPSPVMATQTLAAMTADQSTNALFDPWTSTKTGLGWDQIDDPRLAYAGKSYWKNGATLTYSAMFPILADHKLGVALVANSPGALVNEGAILALQYALNDKAGLHWPTNPVVFPTNAAPVTAGQLEALAGVYAGSSGFDRVRADTNTLTLTYQLDVPHGGRSLSNLVLRDDGWFLSGIAPTFGLAFTNLHGRDIVLKRQAEGSVLFQSILAERFVPPPLPAAWSNRLGKTWLAQNLLANCYLRAIGATPWLSLRQSNGVLYVETASYAVSRALEPVSDTLAWIPGLDNRGDSSVQVIGDDDAILYAGVCYGPAPASLPVFGVVTGDIAQAGFSRWYEIQPASPAAPVGGVSNVYYELALSGAPDNFLLRLCQSDGVTPVAERRGDGALEVVSGGNPLLLSIQPDTDGVQTGAYTIAFSVPLIVRAIGAPSPDVALVWQGPTGTTYAVEGASSLATNDTFAPLRENVVVSNLLHREMLPSGLDSLNFYRVASTNSIR